MAGPSEGKGIFRFLGGYKNSGLLASLNQDASEAHKKSGPISGATFSKRQKGGKVREDFARCRSV
jgi:hypothetical protein